ncbi:MAG TPA: hypothetical protein VG963_28160 [Polyangiaceae bacterium]|nr:hypothetical protein [Polyangiaceae bacterium]
MIRRRKEVDWSRVLNPDDLQYIQQQIAPDGWYPMEVFERLGNAILAHHGATLDAVRMWGHLSLRSATETYPTLIAPGDPVDALMRLKVLRATMFDFHAFDIPMLSNEHAHICVSYQMGPTAEEAACYQTMGFCEGVVVLAGGTDVAARFLQRSWAGDAKTLIDLQWKEDPAQLSAAARTAPDVAQENTKV